MARDPQFVHKYLQEVEQLAEDVLSDKQNLIDLSKKMNSNREALAALTKSRPTCPANSRHNCYVNLGGMFIKFTKDKTVEMLRSDQAEIESNICAVRDGLNAKVGKLRDAEGKSVLHGFDLRPLDKQEVRRVKY